MIHSNNMKATSAISLSPVTMEDADTSGNLGQDCPPQFKGNYFDDDIVPEVRLEKALDLQALREGKSAEFSIDGSEVPVECELDEYKYTDETMQYLNPNMGDSDDDDDDDDDENADENADGDKDNLSPFEKRAKKMKDITPNGDDGVLKKLRREGTGEVVKPDAFVTIHYNMYLEYQDEPADSSFLRNKPLRFPLGKGNVVPGLDLAVRSMRVGETSSFIVRPPYFLGEGGCPPRIPPNSTALFHVELKAAEESGGADEYYTMTSAQRRDASFGLVKQVALREKEEGNSHYKGERYPLALKCYNRAIRITEDCRLQDDNEERMQQKFLFQLYKNAALAAMKIQKPKLALSNINNALYIDRTHAQAFYIKGKALRLVGDYDSAKDALLKAKQLKPNDHDIAKELKRLDDTAKGYRDAQATMYQKMFGGDSNKAKSPSSKDKPLVKDHTSAPKVEEDYVQIVTERLREFKLNSDSHSLPLPQELSATQLRSIHLVCNNLGLDIETKSSDTNTHFLVTKPKH